LRAYGGSANKVEAVLGSTVVLLTVFSILFLYLGVVPSREPGHYKFGPLSNLGRLIIYFVLPALGVIVLLHGGVAQRPLELGLGLLIALWGGWALVMTSTYFIDVAEVGYIKQFPADILFSGFR